MRMSFESEVGDLSSSLDDSGEACRRKWRTALGRENGDFGSCSGWPSKGP
jgi:hypothetical protein